MPVATHFHTGLRYTMLQNNSLWAILQKRKIKNDDEYGKKRFAGFRRKREGERKAQNEIFKRHNRQFHRIFSPYFIPFVSITTLNNNKKYDEKISAHKLLTNHKINKSNGIRPSGEFAFTLLSNSGGKITFLSDSGMWIFYESLCEIFSMFTLVFLFCFDGSGCALKIVEIVVNCLTRAVALRNF